MMSALKSLRSVKSKNLSKYQECLLILYHIFLSQGCHNIIIKFLAEK